MKETLDDYYRQLAVLVTSHPKQHIFMDQAFNSWAGFDGFMLLGYDHTDTNDLPLERWMPPVTETYVTGKEAGYWGHHRGELWQMKKGVQILMDKGFKYFYKTAADNCCYRWRNLKQIFKVLIGKHHDLIICGTTQIFGHLSAFKRCMDFWTEDIPRCGGAELFFNHCIKRFDLRVERMKVGWWNEQLGLIHLQGEYALNTGITVVDTWAIGQLWGKWYSHRDLDPRVKHLKPHIKEQYERSIQKDKAQSGPDGALLSDV